MGGVSDVQGGAGAPTPAAAASLTSSLPCRKRDLKRSMHRWATRALEAATALATTPVEEEKINLARLGVGGGVSRR